MSGEGSVNIFLTGVGGQGIGTLAEVLVRSCLDAGHNVKAVDTHGLAQRRLRHTEPGRRLGKTAFARDRDEGEDVIEIVLCHGVRLYHRWRRVIRSPNKCLSKNWRRNPRLAD